MLISLVDKIPECQLKKLAILLSLFSLLFSCGYDKFTIRWEPDGQGYMQFSTNDRDYEGTASLVHFPSTFNSPMGIVEARLIKQSGSELSPLGIIWRYQNPDNYLILLITVDGWHLHGYMLDGQFYTAGWWQDQNINQGYYSENVIRIDASTEYNDIYINNMTSKSGAIYCGEMQNIGEVGFYASVGDDNVRKNPVDLRFRLDLPLSLPSMSISEAKSVQLLQLSSITRASTIK
jgi:hypothetical protein